MQQLILFYWILKVLIMCVLKMMNILHFFFLRCFCGKNKKVIACNQRLIKMLKKNVLCSLKLSTDLKNLNRFVLRSARILNAVKEWYNSDVVMDYTDSVWYTCRTKWSSNMQRYLSQQKCMKNINKWATIFHDTENNLLPQLQRI